MRNALIALILAGSLAAGRPALLGQIWTFVVSAADEGCRFDPNGLCEPAPQPNAGCRFDPNGSPCES